MNPVHSAMHTVKMATVAIEQKERWPQFSQKKQPDEKVAHLKFQNIDSLT